MEKNDIEKTIEDCIKIINTVIRYEYLINYDNLLQNTYTKVVEDESEILKKFIGSLFSSVQAKLDRYSNSNEEYSIHEINNDSIKLITNKLDELKKEISNNTSDNEDEADELSNETNIKSILDKYKEVFPYNIPGYPDSSDIFDSDPLVTIRRIRDCSTNLISNFKHDKIQKIKDIKRLVRIYGEHTNVYSLISSLSKEFLEKLTCSISTEEEKEEILKNIITNEYDISTKNKKRRLIDKLEKYKVYKTFLRIPFNDKNQNKEIPAKELRNHLKNLKKSSCDILKNEFEKNHIKICARNINEEDDEYIKYCIEEGTLIFANIDENSSFSVETEDIELVNKFNNDIDILRHLFTDESRSEVGIKLTTIKDDFEKKLRISGTSYYLAVVLRIYLYFNKIIPNPFVSVTGTIDEYSISKVDGIIKKVQTCYNHGIAILFLPIDNYNDLDKEDKIKVEKDECDLSKKLQLSNKMYKKISIDGFEYPVWLYPVGRNLKNALAEMTKYIRRLNELISDEREDTEKQIKEIVGREKVKKEISSSLKNKKGDNGIIYIHAGPGYGKSTLIKKLSWDYLDGGLASFENIVKKIVIGTKHNEEVRTPEEFLSKFVNLLQKEFDISIEEGKNNNETKNSIIAALKDISSKKLQDRKLVIMIDGLDEAFNPINSNENIINYIPLENTIPQNIYFIFTSRNIEKENRDYEIFINKQSNSNLIIKKINLETLENNEDDVRIYLKEKLKEKLKDYKKDDIEKILKFTNCNFLFNELLVPLLKEGKIKPKDIENFEEEYKQLGKNEKFKDFFIKHYIPIIEERAENNGLKLDDLYLYLAIVAFSVEPINLFEIVGSNNNRSKFDKSTSGLIKKLSLQTYTIYHEIFKEFLKSYDFVKEKDVDAHKMISDRYLKFLNKGETNKIDPYGYRNLFYHMYKIKNEPYNEFDKKQYGNIILEMIEEYHNGLYEKEEL